MQWIHLDKIYRQMIAAGSDAERERLYQEQVIAPFEGFLKLTDRWMPGDHDSMTRARMMQWRMPEDFQTEPEGLAHLEAVDAWNKGEAALKQAIERFLPYADRATIETDITGSIMLTTPHPMMGNVVGGYAGGQSDGYILVTYHAPDAHNVHKAWGAVAHEYNHRVRLAAFPWDMATVDVAEYVVMEGLAESFAVDLYGDSVLGYYVTDIRADDLERARQLIGDGWTRTGFDTLRAYVFGDSIAKGMNFDEGLGMPDFGGYAVGYHIVQTYLKNTGRTIEEATLTHPHEIIRESGYLDV